MNVDGAQRWRSGRASYRPAGEVIDTRRFEVAAIDGPGADNIARAFVVAHHYSASYPAARERIGLYRGGALVGVAVFSHPAQDKVLGCLPCPKAEAVELGRLVLLDDVPANGESWFIARTFELLRARGYAGVVSFADPVPRSAVGGEVVFPGHLGTIYTAAAPTRAARHARRAAAAPAAHRVAGEDHRAGGQADRVGRLEGAAGARDRGAVAAVNTRQTCGVHAGMRVHDRPIQCRFCGAHLDGQGQVLQEGRPCPAKRHEAHPLVVVPRLFGRGWRGEYRSFRRDVTERDRGDLVAAGIKPPE